MSSGKIKGFYYIYKCCYCQYEIKNSRKAINLHLRLSHGMDHNFKFCGKDEFICRVCKECFPNRGALEYHYKSSKH